MFTKSFRLFSILGFRISIDASWFVLAALIVWSLATGVFPEMVPGLSPTAYYLIAAVGAVGMFASIVYHELAHALVARHYQIKIAGITLFIFGGVAELEDEPPTAKSELLVAIAGPIASLLLAGALLLLLQILPGTVAPGIFALIDYLALMNIVLAVFNLIPAFPLDGGRVLRAILWWVQGSLRKATQIAATLGAALGIALMAYGVYSSFQATSIGGMWQILIGFFIFNAAGNARRQVEVLEALRGVNVGQLMRAPPPAIPADITVEQIAEHPDLRGRDVWLPVVDNEKVIGTVGIAALEKIPPAKRGEIAIRAVTTPLGADEALKPDQSAIAALRQLSRAKSNQALVIRDGQLAGWMHGRDIFDYIQRNRPDGGSGYRRRV